MTESTAPFREAHSAPTHGNGAGPYGWKCGAILLARRQFSPVVGPFPMVLEFCRPHERAQSHQSRKCISKRRNDFHACKRGWSHNECWRTEPANKRLQA